jgi:trigger factor
MQVTKEALEPCQAVLTIEVEPDKVVTAVDRAYREYGKYVSVPGFRKGKAPLSFVKQRVPEADVRQRTAEILVEPAYAAALEQEAVEPFAQPKLELVQLDMTATPFIFKAIVPLRPEVELGNYTGLTVERPKYEMTDENVETQIQRMRERAADYPVVERPAQMGDLVVADLAALVDAKPDAAEARPTMIEIGADNIPGFDDQLIGISKGEEKTFTLTYPADYPDAELAGEEAEFTISVNEIHEKQIPELDDALAQKLSNGRYQTVEDFHREMRVDMEKSLVASAESEADSKLIDQILANSTVKYPPVLVESEVEDDIKELMGRLERQSVTVPEYLERIGKTQDQLVTEITGAAAKRIEIGLLLGKVNEAENLTLTDDDLNAALAERAGEERTSPAAVRAVLEGNGGMDALRNRAQAKKVLDFLRASAIIEDKVVSADSAEEATEDAADEAADALEIGAIEGGNE